jgi:iron complex outermembrane receptor protein
MKITKFRSELIENILGGKMNYYQRPLLKIVSVLLISLFNVISAGAEETYELDEILVVSSPVIEGNLVDRYAGQKTTISEDQVDNLNAQDMTAALRKSPGVNISRYNPVGSFGGGEGGAIFIRGMGSSRPGSEIKVFIDEVPMYMSIWNHPLMDLMSIDTARSIEVYKSPQPQNFGNAVAAVNIIPKCKADKGVTSKTEIAGGSYDTAIGTLESGGRFDQFDYYIGGGYRHSNGHRDHSEGETGDVYSRFGYQINNKWNVYFFGLYSDNFAEDPGEKGADPSEREGTYKTSAYLTSLTLSNNYDKAGGYLKIFRNAGEGDWLDQPTDTSGVTEDLYNDFEFYGLKAKESFRPWEGGEIVTGLDWEYTGGDYKAYYSDDTTNHWDGDDFTMVSPYTAISHTFGSDDSLSVTPSAGVRYYDNSAFGEAWSPHAGVLLGFNSWSCHAGYSRGVVFPGLDVIVFSEEVIPVLGETWKELDPEIMDHYEAGISYTFGNFAHADVTWFYNNGKDRYVFVTSPSSPPVYDNVEEYVTKGVEASVSINPINNLALFFGSTFLRSDPSDLPYAPESTFSAGLNWRFLDVFTLNIDAQYVNDMYVNSQARRATAENSEKVDNYTVLNSKLSYAFEINSSDAHDIMGAVFVAGENLTDTNYEYRPGYPMPGINGMAGVTMTF